VYVCVTEDCFRSVYILECSMGHFQGINFNDILLMVKLHCQHTYVINQTFVTVISKITAFLILVDRSDGASTFVFLFCLILCSWDYTTHVDGLLPVNLCVITLFSLEQCSHSKYSTCNTSQW